MKSEALIVVLLNALWLVLAIGPWTVGLANTFAFREFEANAVHRMVVYLIAKVPISLWRGFFFFVLPPSVLLCLRYIRPKAATLLYWLLLNGGLFVSVMCLFLLLVPSTHNELDPLAQTITADFVLMLLFHVFLIYCEELHPLTFVGGPLFGMCRYYKQSTPRRTSTPLSFLFVYSMIGCLYNAYKRLDDQVLTNRFPLYEWSGFEMYSLISVCYAFILISASVQIPRDVYECLEVIVFIVLLNANIAAAWAVGFYYRSEPKIPVLSKRILTTTSST